MKVLIRIFLGLLFALVLFTGFWGSISTIILPNTTWGLYSRDFFANFLIGLHGNAADFLVVGIIVYWFEKKRTSREKDASDKLQTQISIQRNREALEDLAKYDGRDASYRTITLMKRLIGLGATPVSCTNPALRDLRIVGLELQGAKLHGADFSRSVLREVNLMTAMLDASDFSNAELVNVRLTKASLKRAKFVRARLNGIDFRGSRIDRADFCKAELKSALFTDLDCKGVNFEGADLTQANFLGAKNLSDNAIAMIKRSKGTKHDL
jgi:hypothetical protein